MSRKLICAMSIVSCLLPAAAVWAESLTVIGYNLESGGSSLEVLAERVGEVDGCDLWGFSEVQNAGWADRLKQAAAEGEGDAARFEAIVGTTGGSDRLAIVYDDGRFEKLNSSELHDINVGGRVRAPLVGRFRVREGGQEFLFMVNHLYRSRSARRLEQAGLLNQWARGQTVPVVAVGDYNFDWEVMGGETNHDPGYDALTDGGAFTWVRPPDLIKTHCSPEYNSVLDFVFVSGPATTWHGRSEIIVVDGDCPDNNETSDHRPIRADFDLPAAAPATAPTTAPAATELETAIAKLERLEQELREVRELLERIAEP